MLDVIALIQFEDITHVAQHCMNKYDENLANKMGILYILNASTETKALRI